MSNKISGKDKNTDREETLVEQWVEIPTKKITKDELLSSVPDKDLIFAYAGAYSPPQSTANHLTAFLQMMEDGYYPPISTLKWLAKAFGKHIESEGVRSLDDLLGTNPGPGKQSPFQSTRYREELAEDVSFLYRCGISLAKACKAVEEKAVAGGYSKKYTESSVPCARTLANYFKQERFPPMKYGGKLASFDLKSERAVEKIFTAEDGSKDIFHLIHNEICDKEFEKKLQEWQLLDGSNVEYRVTKRSDQLKELLETFPEATKSWLECEIKY